MLVSAAILSDTGLVWGAFSGVEVPLTALAVLTVAYVYVQERRLGRFRLTPLVAGLSTFVRPELAVLSLAIGLSFALEAIGALPRLLQYKPAYTPGRQFWRFAVRTGPVLAAYPLTYLLFTGLPLPTSVYAKVHAVTSVKLSQQLLAAHAQETIARAQSTLLILSILAAVGLLLAQGHFHRKRAVAVTTILVGYAGAKLMGGPWLGQMQRYLSPFDPLALVGLGFLATPLINRLERKHESPGQLTRVLAPLLTVFVLASTYVVARSDYALHVRNTNEAHVDLAKWLAANTPKESVVASEPIGAIGLFSNRKSIDIYGLATPEMLGHYQDWDFTWSYLRAKRADYLVFYPAWFPEEVPGWLQPVRSVFVRNNRVVGDDIIEAYWINWEQFRPEHEG